MTGIFSTISRMWQLQMITLVNRLIYFTQKLPFAGNLISAQTYAAFRTKRTIGAIAVILLFVAGLLESLLYFGGMFALPMLLWTENVNRTEHFNLLLHMYFCISGVMAGVTSTKVLESNKMKYTSIRLMRINPTKYMRATLFYRYTTFFIYQGIAMTLVAVLFKFSIPHALLIVGMMTFWRLICEFLHLALFKWKGIVLVQKTWATSLSMLLALTFAYLPFTKLNLPLFGSVILDQPWLMTLISLSGVMCGYVLLKYTDFTSAVCAVTNHADPLLNPEIRIADLQQRMVQSKDHDLARPSSSNLHVNEQSAFEKKGYEQLHEIFVTRHTTLLRAPFHRRLLAIMIMGILLPLLVLIFKDHLSLNSIDRFSPFIIMVMLNLTVGSQICKALFCHCDKPLMRYPFYRQHAKKHFLLRFRSILSINLKLGSCLAAVLSVSILVLTGGEDISLLLPIWVITIALAVFFSIHHLLLYYVIQPYTTEFETNSPLFSFVNGLISLSFIVAMFLGPTLWGLTAVIMVLTLAYLSSAVLLVTKYAQNHFRVK
ncbi:MULTISPECIES: hypothetical protein [unclassified Paenibacillus]|uniref:hypothetical protein n=1 Tax=unclassified Paenibacillus TaxID=185978 RepID=UPI00088AB62E|nr:hypothetical protein [Paenibacillus sp. CF095]SDC55815.1 hypothetical protein SAMN05428987_1781 [Paenibacillus sp. CF095]